MYILVSNGSHLIVILWPTRLSPAPPQNVCSSFSTRTEHLIVSSLLLTPPTYKHLINAHTKITKYNIYRMYVYIFSFWWRQDTTNVCTPNGNQEARNNFFLFESTSSSSWVLARSFRRHTASHDRMKISTLSSSLSYAASPCYRNLREIGLRARNVNFAVSPWLTRRWNST